MMKCMLGTLMVISICLTACDGKVRFNQIDLGSKQQIPDPVTPPIVVPDPVFTKTQGACAADSSTSVVSCLKCEIPALPPVEPPMSLKARQLMTIMTAVCPLNNAATGNKYVTPTLDTHKAKLNRCSPLVYADSTPDAGQNDVVQRLLNNDILLQKKMFTGLWYQPPYSDYFETYFGLEVGEAIKVFCMQSTETLSGWLVPSMTMANPYGPVYEAGDALPAMYITANGYRDGLSACMPQSKYNPWKPSAPPVAKTCTYETLSGDAGDKVNAQVSAWLTAGYTIGADLKSQGICSSVKSLNDIQSYQGPITVGAYICK